MATAAATPTQANLATCRSCSKPTRPGKGYCDAKCEVDWLRGENARLERNQAKPRSTTITVKRSAVTDKDGNPTATGGNAVSIYGLGRFPITLYREQAERLFSDAVRDEVLALAKTLPYKDGSSEPKAQGPARRF